MTVVALLPTNKIRATRDATTAKVWRVEEKMKRTLHPRCWTKAEHYQVDLEFAYTQDPWEMVSIWTIRCLHPQDHTNELSKHPRSQSNEKE